MNTHIPMKIFKHFFLICPLFIFLRSNGQINCDVKNSAFKIGEELQYKVIYNWGPIWLESAYGTFKVNSVKHYGKNCFALSGSGGTYSKYDWFFKVRDEFETFVDTESFRPLKFRADISEGSKKDKHIYVFDNSSLKAYTIINRGKKPVQLDTLNIAVCSIDVLTAIYYARNLDYSHCKIRDTLSISLLLDGKLFPIYIRYLGKAVYTSKELGTFNCLKFSPLLVEGSIFKKGEDMTVWVSDDRNKIPLYIETPITIGMIKVKLMSYKGLRNNMDAKIK